METTDMFEEELFDYEEDDYDDEEDYDEDSSFLTGLLLVFFTLFLIFLLLSTPLLVWLFTKIVD